MTSNSTRLRIAVSSGRSPGSPTTRSWRPEPARPSTLEVVAPKRPEETSDRHQPEPHRPGGLGRLAGWVKTHRASIAILVPVLVLVGMVHALGMNSNPQRLDDEGTYVSQAWAVLHWNTLAHYTYWYDHPPLGWILVGLYSAATGAFTRAPNAVAAGRELMLVLQLVSATLLYIMARRLGLRRIAAVGAVLLFSLSPLALEFHRAVYLDNIATPFVLAAFVLALSPQGRLAAFAGSGFCFGVAALCKETILVLLPALVWQLWRGSDQRTRRYSLAVAGSVFVLTGSFYLLFAALRGELLPGPGHVSLVDGIAFQLLSRKASGSPFDPSSPSHQTIVSWLRRDPWLVPAALALLPVCLAIRRVRPLAAGLLVLAVIVARPGYLPIPFVIAVLPLAALVVAAVIDAAWGRLRSSDPRRPATARWRRWAAASLRVARAGMVGIVVVTAVNVIGPGWRERDHQLMAIDRDRPMTQAEQWIAANVPRASPILVDDALWVDLVRSGRPPDRVVWFWKLDRDPEIKARYPDGWRHFQYVVSTTAVRGSFYELPYVSAALEHGTVVASFGTGEDQVQILRVQPDGNR
jgi:Dolichyl-phosphate-mannose-protein mannosyltransferase